MMYSRACTSLIIVLVTDRAFFAGPAVAVVAVPSPPDTPAGTGTRDFINSHHNAELW